MRTSSVMGRVKKSRLSGGLRPEWMRRMDTARELMGRMGPMWKNKVNTASKAFKQKESAKKFMKASKNPARSIAGKEKEDSYKKWKADIAKREADRQEKARMAGRPKGRVKKAKMGGYFKPRFGRV